MCGIFGILLGSDTRFTSTLLKRTIDYLFILSESRGKEASGIAMLCNDELSIYKQPLSPHTFICRKGYRQLTKRVIKSATIDSYTTMIRKHIAIIGHTRLITNGTHLDNDNSPIIVGSIVGIHNGIVVNDDYIWRKFPCMKKNGSVDSEVIFGLLDLFNKRGLSLIESVRATFSNIEGSASIAAFVLSSNNIILATNTGSLYTCKNITGDVYIFASELPILHRLIARFRLMDIVGYCNISQLKANHGYLIDINSLTEEGFNIGNNNIDIEI